jgi:transposase-like protein
MTRRRWFAKEFEEEAVRRAQTRGRTRREIAGDPGIGLSTPARWIGRSREGRRRPRGGGEPDHGGAEAAGAGERDPSAGAGHPEEGPRLFRPGGKSTRIALIDPAQAQCPVHRPCRVLGVSQGGYFTWRARRSASLSPPTRRHGAAGWRRWRISGRPLLCRRHPWQSRDEAGTAGWRSASVVAGRLA